MIHPNLPHPTSLHYCADNVSNNKPSITQYAVTAASGGSSATFLVLERKLDTKHALSARRPYRITCTSDLLTLVKRVQLNTELTNTVTGDLEGSNTVNVKAQRF